MPKGGTSVNSFFHCGPCFDSEVENFCSSWRSRPLEHGSTHHMEAWTFKLSHVLSFDRIDFAKIGLCRIENFQSNHSSVISLIAVSKLGTQYAFDITCLRHFLANVNFFSQKPHGMYSHMMMELIGPHVDGCITRINSTQLLHEPLSHDLICFFGLDKSSGESGSKSNVFAVYFATGGKV